jgi:hypothetical protein
VCACEFVCPAGSFDCGGNVCLVGGGVCNGYTECPSGADEVGCNACPSGTTDCADSKTLDVCLNGKWTSLDCEQACADDGYPLSTGCGYSSQFSHDVCFCSSGCPPGALQCIDGQCVPASAVCDGTPQCAQGEDEAACNICEVGEQACNGTAATQVCLGTHWLTLSCETVCAQIGLEYTTGCSWNAALGEYACTCTNVGCGPGSFTCFDGTCLLAAAQCDGFQQCAGGEDEALCPGACPTQPAELYDCPPTDAEMPGNPGWCAWPKDTDNFDHEGNCYRSIPPWWGQPGQQCCYDDFTGVDNCTGSPDLIAPAVAPTPFGNCIFDPVLACVHCNVDVRPFCDAVCDVQYCEGPPFLKDFCGSKDVRLACTFPCAWQAQACGGVTATGKIWSELTCDCNFLGDWLEGFSGAFNDFCPQQRQRRPLRDPPAVEIVIHRSARVAGGRRRDRDPQGR